MILAAALGGAESAQATDPTPFLIGTGVATPNVSANVTALKGSAGTSLDIENVSAGATAIYGFASAVSGVSTGVYGKTNSTGPGSGGVNGVLNTGLPGAGSAGIFGSSFSTTGEGPGVFGQHLATIGKAPGVLGETNSSTPFASAIQGKLNAATVGVGATAVRGDVTDSSERGIGVLGAHYGSGVGVYGYSPGGYAVYGDSLHGWAGYFAGNVFATGSLFRGAGGSMIDNPLDPAHKYLTQSDVESPDMKTIYDGVATTDAKGFAVVKLPAYFQALNKDYRYQLTSLSGLQQVAVAKEISNNRFTIQSEKPHARVSWQVTGIRQDRYANAHRIQPVQEKAKADQGKYLNPQLYGEPRSKTLGYQGQFGGSQPLARPAR